MITKTNTLLDNQHSIATVNHVMIKNKYHVEASDRKEVEPIIMNNHYAHRMPMIQYAFKLVDNDAKIVGIITYGIPASHSLVVGVAGEENQSYVVELNRLWTEDNLPRNTLSYFVSTSLKMIGNHIVVSYSDTGMHHNGFIYQATNFIFTGQTKKRTDIYTGVGKHSRHYSENADKDLRIVRTPKNRYVIVVGDKKFKRNKISEIKYPKLPYPKEDNEHYKVGDSKKEIVFRRTK